MPGVARALARIVVPVLLAGCGTRGPVEDSQKIALLGFLQPGGTTRQEVGDRLGTPGREYEGGRVVTYALEERDGRLSATPYSGRPGYTLVLEFSADGKLARRALVRRP